MTDRPRLIGWGSLHRAQRLSLTSFVVIAGTASPVPGPAGSWLDAHLAVHASRSPARPRPPPPRALRRDVCNDRDAFRRVVIDRVTPIAAPVCAFLVECAARARAPFSPRSRRLVCQHVGAESSSASAVSPICLAAPRASRRAMRRTDFCLLTFFVRAPAPRRFPVCHALARRTPGVIACLTSVRFASVGHTFVVLSPRWAFSSRRDACDPYLWHPCRLSHSCHVARATCAPVEAAETALSPIA